MKKLLIFTAAVFISFTGIAQDNHNGNGHNKNKEAHYNKHKAGKDYDDNYRNPRNNGNINLPAKVRAAFNRDFPSVTNVSWSKNKGYWTAVFSNGIYRSSVTYAANGQRVNGIATGRRTTYTSPSQDGSIWDKILSRQ